jgi:glycosyltransferase involved in cell wall biosynthesis
MRIALATALFLPKYYGGVETYTLNLAKAFQARGCEVCVLCIEPGAQGSEPCVVSETFAGVEVRRFHLDLWTHRSASVSLWNDTVARLAHTAITEWAPDIVHLTSLAFLSLAFVVRLKQSGISVVYTATEFSLTCSRHGQRVRSDGVLCEDPESFDLCFACQRPRSIRDNAAFDALRRLPQSMRSRALELLPADLIGTVELGKALLVRERMALPTIHEIDLIIAPSSWMKTMLVRNGLAAQKIVIAAYGVEESTAPCSKDQTGSQGRFQFGFLGRIHPLKGAHDIVAAFRSIDGCERADLTIFGAPDQFSLEYAGRLWHLTKGAPNVHLAGEVSREDLAAALCSIDALVVGSIWYENAPIVILEALMQGIPVIATNVNGITDLIVHELNGLLYPPGDVDALRGLMQRLLDEPDLLPRLKQGIKKPRSIAQDAEQLIDYYQTLCVQPE